MDISSLILGVLVLATVIVLESRNRPVHRDPSQSELDRDYLVRRRRGRRMVHGILGLIACLAFAAGITGPGHSFLLLWAAVPLLILLVVLLAFIDAYQTYRYHERKLPEVRKLANLDPLPEDTDA